ncbi:MAG TPA: DNA-binding protein [Candidatus Thermoplasmatota archaeon]
MSSDEKELEAIRRRKFQEIAHQQEAAQAQAEQAAQVETQRQIVLRGLLTPEARERLGRLKTAYPDIAGSVEDQLLSLYQSGRLRNMIDDETLKRILAQVVPRKRDIKIERR